MAVLPRSRCSRLLPLACIALLGACSSTPKPAKPPERVTGAGGSMLRYSSKQTTIELTPAERAAVDQVRVRAYPASDAAQLRDACAAALQAAGYEQVTGDAATDIVTGERHQKLVGRSREALRGLLKSQGLAYGAKPDHQSTYAQLVIRRDGAQARVWIGLNSTIWDSNGDAKSRVVTDAAAYQDLFARLDQALKTPAR